MSSFGGSGRKSGATWGGLLLPSSRIGSGVAADEDPECCTIVLSHACCTWIGFGELELAIGTQLADALRRIGKLELLPDLRIF